MTETLRKTMQLLSAIVLVHLNPRSKSVDPRHGASLGFYRARYLYPKRICPLIRRRLLCLGSIDQLPTSALLIQNGVKPRQFIFTGALQRTWCVALGPNGLAGWKFPAMDQPSVTRGP
ncbi:hypothetical protein HNY73_013306 [Argiope bruennichi]|uniref:Uncharacterized protein n=1 Tax=Argiope bruennichi TaxID=94029 RepID=A0A8T0EZT8_ARGBR|nr:hypothetical protein HNY73_013306 [Argiope bruennichi]